MYSEKSSSRLIERSSSGIASVDEPIVSQIIPKVTYSCGQCGYHNQIKPEDVIKCQVCGYKILYKIRTTRMIQFEAR